MITQELLLKLAREYITKKLRQPNDIVSVYLTGSVLSGSPLIGAATDIDLVFVHKDYPPTEREVVRISNEISLDIEHHHQSFYTFHRRLRQNAWIGYALCQHEAILHDSDHWLEFIQAGVSARFNTPENAFARAYLFSEKARQQWFDLNDPQKIPFETWLDQYFKAVGSAANAIATLSGPALTQRRFMLDFPSRAEALDQISMVGELAHLIGNDHISENFYRDWRPAWEFALASASHEKDCPPNLNKARRAYFLDACDALANQDSLHAVLWPILETWRQAASFLKEQPSQIELWLSFAASLGFTPDAKEEKINHLDRFIDHADQLLSSWKQNYGL